MKIIQLHETDAQRLLWLIQNESTTSPIYNDYWANMADTVTSQLEQQQAGKFFQCAGCLEQQVEPLHDPDR